ncbi:MAG: protein-glutamate O-methyltransferase CheR [Candidatus Riflebacteria bacterium]|nr:protein-glutamate O-methyltransferase CheR [Candidatus Riflebacteria bacterium]
MIQFGPEQHEQIAEFISNYSGIVIDRLQPKRLGEKVIAEARRLNLSSFEDYLLLLKSSAGESTRDSLMAKITITESFFFRNPSQFRYLGHEHFPQLYRQKKMKGLNEVNIWSAGCSTGEETYSLAYIASWFQLTHPDISFSITGTDINIASLEKCRIGCYRPRSLRTQVASILQEFAMPLGRDSADGFLIEEQLRRITEFRFANLRDLSSLKCRKGLDIIFCRNVLIYFEDSFQQELICMFHNLLQPGGMLFLGETESLPTRHQFFELVPCCGAYGYRRPFEK